MIRKTLFLLLITLLLASCGPLLPEEAELPPPVPTAVPFDGRTPPPVGMVVDPVSSVVPAVDPQIMALVDAVSQQQLQGYIQTMQSFGTRSVFSVTTDPEFGIGAARNWLYGELQRVGNGRLQVTVQEFPLYYNGLFAQPQNVVAVLPGRQPDSGAIVIGAHYDNRAPDVTDGESPAPGANDNGSGIALLLESARLLSAYEWNRTIIFVAFAAEEQGTFGAKHFVQESFLAGIDVIAALNYDAIGGREGIPEHVRLFAADLLASPSGDLARYYEYVGGLYLPAFPVRVIDGLDREGRWGDQREFVNAGLAGVRVIESEEDPDLVNSVWDTWDRINYDYLQKIVQLNVAVVASMAGAPPAPETPLISADGPDGLQLRWYTEEGVAGYAVSLRPVDQSSYPPFRFVRAAEAGNILLTGLDAAETYAVSMSALDENGRLAPFTPEVIVEPAVVGERP
jgi:hypothetical protein